MGHKGRGIGCGVYPHIFKRTVKYRPEFRKVEGSWEEGERHINSQVAGVFRNLNFVESGYRSECSA
jgi:hypothetical protein